MSVMVPLLVPFTRTLAPIMGSVEFLVNDCACDVELLCIDVGKAEQQGNEKRKIVFHH